MPGWGVRWLIDLGSGSSRFRCALCCRFGQDPAGNTAKFVASLAACSFR
ncbi:MAG: hypothetical protein F4Y06_00135 [Rhodospirillales bacterium]|nr:hypothetical protein [Rhodospirillales bacterium]